jgi:hypothetical protein
MQAVTPAGAEQAPPIHPTVQASSSTGSEKAVQHVAWMLQQVHPASDRVLTVENTRSMLR